MSTIRAIAVLGVLGALAGCDSQPPPRVPAPTTVACADASHLRQRALEDRRLSGERRSDQEKIYIGNRAGFFASLAIVADLKCKVTLAEADEALKPAFEAARLAEATRSTYEMAARWSEADFLTTQVIALLIRQLPVSPVK